MISLRKPSAIKDDPVSPGCTLPEITIKSLLFVLPTVIRGIFLPS